MRLENPSTYRYRGWLSATAVLTEEQAGVGHGTCRGLPFVVGKPTGLRGHRVSLAVDLPPGTNLSAPLEFAAAGTNAPPLKAPPFARMGFPSVLGVPLAYQDLSPQGQWRVHLRARVTPMLVVDLWTALVSDGWAPFLAHVTASNTGLPDVTATVPEGFDLQCGGAVVQTLKGGFGTLLPAGMSMGDGQSLFIPGSFVWPGIIGQDQEAFDSARAFAAGLVGAWDEAWESNLGPLKALAASPAGFSGEAWAKANYQGALYRLQTWQEGPLGITANSGQTGAEEEQPGLAKGEAVFRGGGFPAIQTLRYVGLGFGRVPCHYRESDGSPLSLQHPSLMIWDGRPHKAMPDLLGKEPDSFGSWLSHDWWGPNDEHAFIGTPCSAYQLTGDEGLQQLIDDRARLWLYSDTVDPRMSTSGPRAARARGWASIEAAWFWLTLEDRGLAQKVKDRYLQRLAMYREAAERDGWLWDKRAVETDESTGQLMGLGMDVWRGEGPTQFPAFFMGYQAAVACGGIQVAGEVMGIPEARELAYREALALMDGCFRQNSGGQWEGWEVLGVRNDGTVLRPEEFVEGRGAHHSGLFDGGAWWALGIWTILRHEPGNVKARAIWNQWKTAAGGGSAWLLPGVEA